MSDFGWFLWQISREVPAILLLLIKAIGLGTLIYYAVNHQFDWCSVAECVKQGW